MLWNLGALFSSDHKTQVATIAQGQDISERKRVEDEKQRILEESQVLYKACMGRESRVLELIAEVDRLKKELGKE